MELVKIICAIILPPLGVFLQVGLANKHFWINIVASNSHFAPKRALLNGIEGFLGSIGGCVTHSCSAFSARRSQATCFWGPLGSFRAH